MRAISGNGPDWLGGDARSSVRLDDCMNALAPAGVPSRPSPPAIIDVAAAICLLAGNTIGGFVCPPEWIVLGTFPPVWAGIAFVLIRVVWWNRPSLIETWRPRITWGHLTRTVVLVALVSRVGVLAAGLVASHLHPAALAPKPRISDNIAITLPARWDAFWYLEIARYGYNWQPDREDVQQNIAFFPAYPAVMRVAGDLVTIPAAVLHRPEMLGSGAGRTLWGAAAASILLFALALARVHAFASAELGTTAADRTCLLLATYPFALFYGVPYSESLALLALVSLVVAWRAGRASGAVWGVLFGLSRSNGWCVAIALAVDHLVRRPRSHRAAAWLLIASAPLGAALYSAYIYHLTGHPFQWATAQHPWGGEFHPQAFVLRRWELLQQTGWRTYLRRDPADVASFFAVGAMVVIAVWQILTREWLHGVLILAYLAPAVAIDLPAVGRMTSLLFPAFMFLARRIKGPWFAVLAGLFAATETWFACRFFLWRTPY